MKKCFFILLAFFINIPIFSEDNFWNIYDPDSLAIIALLDSNAIAHDIFQDVIWMVLKETANDSDWRVTKLNLRPEDLPNKLYCLPLEIGNLTRISWLEVANHNLEHVPVEIADIEWLYVLDLRYNPLKEIPAELAQCPKLDYLGLAYTNITSFSDEFLDLDSIRPCNYSIDTINGNIYPHNVIDLCGLENFTLTERQKVWADVKDYEEYEQKYCQQSDIVIPDKKLEHANPAGITVKVRGYAIELTLEREGLLSLSLFDSRGKKVRTIIYKKIVPKGSITIQMDRNISSGVYFLRGRFSGVAVSKKIIIKGGI